MSITGKILFANNISNIISGENVKLIIKIENNEKIFIKGIFLNLRGEVKVKWEDLLNKPKDGKIIYIMEQYEGEEICIDQHIEIKNMDILHKGEHIFDVIIDVPQKLPQSIESTYGSIKYELILGLKHATGNKEILHTIPVEIIEYLNIAGYFKDMLPFRTVYTKSFCWGLCKIQPLKLTLVLPTTSVLVNEHINYYAFIENYNRFLDIQRLSIILIQTQCFRALKPKERVKQVHTTLISQFHNFNSNHYNSRIEGYIKLPKHLIITSDQSCLIMTSYKLQFIIILKGFHPDGYITVPIIVGSHRGSKPNQIGDFVAPETKLQIENEISEICI